MPLVIDGYVDNTVGADSQQPDGALDGAMALVVAQDAKGWCAGQSLSSNIPAQPGQQSMSGGGKTGHMSH